MPRPWGSSAQCARERTIVLSERQGCFLLGDGLHQRRCSPLRCCVGRHWISVESLHVVQNAVIVCYLGGVHCPFSPLSIARGVVWCTVISNVEKRKAFSSFLSEEAWYKHM